MHEHEARSVITDGAGRGVSALRAIREHRGLSIETLAEEAGFDVELLTACEQHHGVAAPSPCFKESLARALGVPMDVLFSKKLETV